MPETHIGCVPWDRGREPHDGPRGCLWYPPETPCRAAKCVLSRLLLVQHVLPDPAKGSVHLASFIVILPLHMGSNKLYYVQLLWLRYRSDACESYAKTSAAQVLWRILPVGPGLLPLGNGGGIITAQHLSLLIDPGRS